MLARLDRTRGIGRSFTSWEGNAIAVETDLSREQAVAAIASALGEGYSVEAANLDERWYDHEECFALSAHEAHLLGERHARKVAAAVGLDAREEAKLAALLEDSWRRIFTDFHEERAVLSRKTERALWKREIPRVLAAFPERADALRAYVARAE